MEGDEGLLSTGSLNYESEGSEQKLEKKLQKQGLATGIWTFRDQDLNSFGHVLGSFLKNVAKTSRSDGVLSAGGG